MRIDLWFKQRYLHFAISNSEITFLLLLSLQSLKISYNIIDTNSNDVLIMKSQRFPAQEAQHVFFPMIEINEAVHVVGKKIIERAHGEEESKQPNNMTDHLNYRFEIHQPMRPQKD